jgi:GNAT superfamily N-acetyltransferase
MALEHLTPDLTMGQETLAECLDDQTKQLLMLHWQEIAPHQDLPLDPNYAGYEHLEALGMLRCYIFRDHGLIQGYAVFMVTPSLKYQTVIEAHADLLWLAPRFRGQGYGPRFMGWCDEQLAKDGVTIVRHAAERTLNFGSVLEKLGYEFEQHVWCRRLDKR